MGMIKDIVVHYANLLRGQYDIDEVSDTPIYDQLEREWLTTYGSNPLG